MISGALHFGSPLKSLNPGSMAPGYPESAGGQAAGHVFGVDTPEGCNTPGLRSYYASMVGLAALGAFIGLCNGTVDGERFRVSSGSACRSLSVSKHSAACIPARFFKSLT